VRFAAQAALLAVAILSVLAGWEAQAFATGLNGVQVASGILAIGAILIGYQQWQTVRIELSIDKFYERLTLSNRRLDDSVAARNMLRSSPLDTVEEQEERNRYERAMYVYAELDNLEYVIEKYYRGLMDPGVALRSLHLFRGRCEYANFRGAALYLASVASYNESTLHLVRRLCDDAVKDSPLTNADAVPQSLSSETVRKSVGLWSRLLRAPLSGPLRLQEAATVNDPSEDDRRLKSGSEE
jgi:hypothetical protein